MRWTQKIETEWFSIDTVADVLLNLEPVAFNSGDGAVGDDGAVATATSYLIDGVVRLDVDNIECEALGARQTCDLLAVVDASVVGLANLEGDVLRIEVDWGRFGMQSSPGVPELVVGRWRTGDERGDPAFATSTSDSIAIGLEFAGLIGGAVFIEAHNGASVKLQASLGVGSGGGTLELSGL
ncbi:MAG: hypothetical protein GY708_05500 [Actinomycetia bacterium]|nr:hypothetical protein [Actinomycetes bacterium]